MCMAARLTIPNTNPKAGNPSGLATSQGAEYVGFDSENPPSSDVVVDLAFSHVHQLVNAAADPGFELNLFRLTEMFWVLPHVSNGSLLAVTQFLGLGCLGGY